MPCMLVSGCWIVGVVLILLWLLLSRVTNLSFVYMADAGILEYCYYFKGLNALPHFTVGPSFAYGTTRRQIFCSADDTDSSKASCVVSDQMVENLLSNCNFSSFSFLNFLPAEFAFLSFCFCGSNEHWICTQFHCKYKLCYAAAQEDWLVTLLVCRLFFLVVKTSCK